MKHLLIAIAITCFAATSKAQILKDREVDESTVEPWSADLLKDYSGIYNFAPDDGNYLLIITNDSSVTAQLHFPAHWTNVGMALELGLAIADSADFQFHSEFVNLTGVKIVDGKFISDQYKGEFILFGSNTQHQGVKIYNSWNSPPKGKYEIGIKTPDTFDDYFDGDYIKTSTTILDSHYLLQFTKYELRIMRNEIFARYHYAFKDGGEMAQYFSKKAWYSESAARYKSVAHQLTSIELRNVALIKSIESQK